MVGKPAETVENELKAQKLSESDIKENIPHRVIFCMIRFLKDKDLRILLLFLKLILRRLVLL